MNKALNEAMAALQRAYDMTDRMAVSGGAIEQMADLRSALRDAFAEMLKLKDTAEAEAAVPPAQAEKLKISPA